MSKPYDIFISYRRQGGAQYARILQLMLSRRGYEVFLDYDELTDGIFGDHIREAIVNSSVFMLILSEGALDRCVNEDDWVRQEISLAVSERKHIIPVDPDGAFKGMPDEVPDFIKAVANDHSRSEIHFGQTLAATVDFMVEKRVAPVIGLREAGKQKSVRKFIPLICAVTVLMLGLVCFSLIRHHRISNLMTEVVLDDRYPYWSDDITLRQIETVHELLNQMEPLNGGKFMMGAGVSADGSYDTDVDVMLETPQIERTVGPYHIAKYEITVGQWARIMREKYDKSQEDMPKTGITLHECRNFVSVLSELTGIPFSIPTEEEWEYAARGGDFPDNCKYSGSDNPDEVAWYISNSGARPHRCNAKSSGMDANGADLFDMSGNVSEWCDSPFMLYSDIAGNTEPEILNEDNVVMRGGNYMSERYELMITHRDPVPSGTSLSTLGLRLVIRY